MYFLGVDSGPTGTSAVVLNLESASVAARSRQGHELSREVSGGHCEQDPVLWIRAVDHTVRECLAQLGEGRTRVAGVGVSGESGALVVLDAGNRIVRPAKLRGDRSAARQGEEISRAFGGAPGLIELTGNPLGASSLAARMQWLRQSEPYHYREVASVLTLHDFVNYWMAGVKRTEFGEASHTGLLDVRDREWCRELVEFVDPALGEMLPPIGSSREPLGVLRGELARAWGLGEGVLVSAGGPREAMAALGAGVALDGMVLVETGPAGMICGIRGEAAIDSRGELETCCDVTDRWLPMARREAAALCAGQVGRHYGWGEAEVEAALGATKPGAQGLRMLPAMSGDFSVGVRDGRGVLMGMEASNLSASNVTRAAFEALALEFGRALGRMRELGLAPAEVRLAGKNGGGPGWRQLLADVFGVPVRRAPGEADAAFGAALQAAVTFFSQSGEDLTFAEIANYVDHAEGCGVGEPDAERHAFYREMLERHDALGELFRGGEP